MGKLENPALALLSVMKRLEYKKVSSMREFVFQTKMSFPALKGMINKSLVPSGLTIWYDPLKNQDSKYRIVDVNYLLDYANSRVQSLIHNDFLLAMKQAAIVTEAPIRITFDSRRLLSVHPDFNASTLSHLKIRGIDRVGELIERFWNNNLF
ncbi:hypothetical protein [Ralstonia phage RP13]|nr:hypothetical protein [Ralstonia phage RP13]